MNSTGSPLAPLRECVAARAAQTKERTAPQRVGKNERRLGGYTVGRQLGAGGNGVVSLGRTLAPSGTTEVVAVKQTVVISDKSTKEERAAFQKDPNAAHSGRRAIHEAEMQALCHDHPNVATAFDLLRDDTSIFLVMEFGDDGDLFDYVLRKGPLESGVALGLFRQIASAVAYMHERGIAHCDIKPENVLLTNACRTPMLTDFGCAVEFKPGDALLGKRVGTRRCQPPEMHVKNRESGRPLYDPMAVDVWGLGVLLFFMLTCQFPFDGRDEFQTTFNILRGDVVVPLPESTPDSVVVLLRRMLEHKRTQRTTMEGLMELLKAEEGGCEEEEH